MPRDFLDRYSRLDSPVHRLSPALKAGTALGLVVAAALTPLWRVSWLVLPAGFLVLVATRSRVPARFLLGRLLLLEPFAMGVAVLALWQPHGWAVALAILARSTICLAAMIVLTSVTPFPELLGVLRRVRVPALLVTVLALMYRYLFVLGDEAERMRRARLSRTFVTRRRRVWSASAGPGAQLFVRSTERAERIWAAMCARGWQ